VVDVMMPDESMVGDGAEQRRMEYTLTKERDYRKHAR
jgi:hypothetical protein